MTDSVVTIERDGHVMLIGVDRAAKYNAFSLEVIDQFSAAYQEFAEDSDSRVVVLFGHGPHFSAGLDLAQVGPEVARRGPNALSGGYRYDPFGMWAPLADKPVVMAVQGISYTLSIELALASDIVIAAEDVRFRQLEIGRGILPFGGATIRAPRHLGWGNAMRFLLTGEEFGAAEALRIGLVQEVVSVGEQVDRARAIAQVIAAQAPLGVQGTLINARIAYDEGFAAAKQHLVETLPTLMASADAAEGIRSFIERREAVFEGK